MSLTSSVPAIQFTEAGLVIPQVTDILAGVIEDINSAFGGGLNPSLETPQGQLASSETAVISDKNNEFAYYVNQIDPQYSSGRFQDAIARIYFLNRKGAEPTVVQVTLIGLEGTIVPVGTLAQDTSGNTYSATGTTVIDVTGSTLAEFANIIPGAIPCPAGTLIQVYQAIPGWDAITNPADGVLGRSVESRNEFEFRRKNSVALNGRSTVQAIYATVFNMADVLDVYVVDNPLNTTVNTGSTNYPIGAHSVYVAAVGGLDQDVAEAIWFKKDLGCNYNGNTSVTVIDTSGYSYPQPSYVVKFERPTSLPILFKVQIVNDPSLPSNIVELVQKAIIAKFNGLDGTNRERIGASIFASQYYAPISRIGNIAIISILIGTATATLSVVNVGIDQSPTVSASDIDVILV